MLQTDSGTPINLAFSPADLIETNRVLEIQFSGTTTGTLTLDGSSKAISYLRFAGQEIDIPGTNEQEALSRIPDMTGEWLFASRTNGNMMSNVHLLQLRLLQDGDDLGIELPEAPVIYYDLDNPGVQALFYCFPDTFNNFTPACTIRIEEEGALTQLFIPVENISPDRFESAASLAAGNTTRYFGLRIGGLLNDN